MLRVFLVYSFVILLGLFFEGSVIANFIPNAVVPDVLVVMAVYVALRFRTLPGLIGVFLLGIIADFATAIYVGPNAAGTVAVFVLTGILANRVYAERIFAIVLISFVCSLCKSTVIVSLLYYYVNPDWNLIILGRTMVFEALATACIAPIVVKLLQLAHLRKGVGLFSPGSAKRRNSAKAGARSKKKVSGTGAWGASSR
jgi:rod shape-determining protein MreD